MITGIAIVKKALAEVKKESEKFFQGELTISKRDCWLIGAILVLLGVAIGFINAPLTHGININIASGNASGNRTGMAAKEDGDEEVEENALCKPDAPQKRKRHGRKNK